MRYLRLLPLLLLVTPAFAQSEAPERRLILRLSASGKAVEALAAARDWTLKCPALPDALVLYAQLQESVGDVAGALDSLDAAYFLTRDVNLLVRKGSVYMESGQLEAAQRQFRQVLRQHETCVPAHIGLALIMLEQRDYAEASSAARAALAIDPGSVEAQVALARLETVTGRYGEAEALLLKVVAAHPEQADAHLWLGRVYSDTDRATQARAQWRSYIELQPAEGTSWLLTNNLYLTRSAPYPCSGYFPAFAPDGKHVAFRGRGDAGSLYLTTVDHPEQGERIYQSNATIWTLDWSPDSKYLLCRDYLQETVEGKQQYKYRLFVQEAVVGGKSTMIFEGRYVGQPSWGLDGKSVLFDGYVQGKGRVIQSTPLTGGVPTVAVSPQTGETLVSCQWLPDGKRAVLQRWSATDKEYQVLLTDLVDRKQDKILVRSEQALYYTALSPDSRYLLYYRRLGQPPQWNLMAAPLDNPGVSHALGARTQQMLPPTMTTDLKHILLYVGPNLSIFDLDGVADR